MFKPGLVGRQGEMTDFVTKSAVSENKFSPVKKILRKFEKSPIRFGFGCVLSFMRRMLPKLDSVIVAKTHHFAREITEKRK
ncbi:MAG: hypothetical protein FWC50_12930 [Planctomycetaceae bacterium]|nr:hypothetical protein [Planctomycetaceae bacterium]